MIKQADQVTFKKPEKRKDMAKRKYTEKDWRREAMALFNEIRQKGPIAQKATRETEKSKT